MENQDRRKVRTSQVSNSDIEYGARTCKAPPPPSEGGDSAVEEESDYAATLRARLNAKMASLLSLDDAGDSSAAAAPSSGAAAGAARQAVVSPSPARTQTSPAHDEAEDDPAAEATEAAAEAVAEKEAPEEVGFHFRLFASEGAAPRILLTPEAEERGLTAGPDSHGHSLRPVRRRPLSHYLKGEASAVEREQFELVARTAADIRDAAAQRNWGLEVPWRVTRITVSTSGAQSKSREAAAAEAKEGVTTEGGDAEPKRRKRPGKKRRIRQRTKDAARVAQEMAMKKQAAEKEEHLKEKKKRLNREKKLKRRQKERDQKRQASQGEVGRPLSVTIQRRNRVRIVSS